MRPRKSEIKTLVGESIVMKKRGRILLWIAFAVLVLFLVTTVAMKPEIDGSANDIFLYKMGGASLFAIWLFGVVLELDIFHIKKNIPLIKSKRISAHIIFWIGLLIVSLIAFGIFNNLTSPDFRKAMEEAKENQIVSDSIKETESGTQHTTKTTEDVTETSKEIFDLDNGKENIVTSQETLKNGVDYADEETNSEAVSGVIENETYYFDHADFEVNGIQLTVQNITLHRENKPEGYKIEIAYSLRNQNDTDATFEFSSQAGNSFVLEGQKARMTKQATYSKVHATEYSLKAMEETGVLIGDFNALSSAAGKMIDGESFEAVDIGNIYSGQNLTINFQVSGICGGQTETMAISFEIEL